jgi:hypothetical protein
MRVAGMLVDCGSFCPGSVLLAPRRIILPTSACPSLSPPPSRLCHLDGETQGGVGQERVEKQVEGEGRGRDKKREGEGEGEGEGERERERGRRKTMNMTGRGSE